MTHGNKTGTKRRATIFLMVIGLLAMLFIIITAYITLARFDRLTLGQVQRKHLVDEMISGVNQLAFSRIRMQWADGLSNSLSGGLYDKNNDGTLDSVLASYSYENVSGYPGQLRGSSYIAALEPVRDPAVLSALTYPGAYRYPSVTSFGEGPEWGLDPETNTTPAFHPYNLDAMMEINKNNRISTNAGNGVKYRLSLGERGRQPFMDADGDSVADARLREIGAATELVNATAGNPISAANDPQNPTDPRSQRFNQNARYDAPVRIVSHGGMFAIGAPGDAKSWNRQFVVATLNGLNKDGRLIRPNDPLFNNLFTGASAVEPLWRRRGGMMPTWRDPADKNSGSIPDTLRVLETGYPKTMGLLIDRDRDRATFTDDQRFNIATYNSANNNDPKDEFRVWRRAMVLDPLDYADSSKRTTALADYDRRHLMTAISLSDEVARKQRPDAQIPDYSVGLYTGQLKFYLGDIAQAFDSGGFYDPQKGPLVVKRLAGYYREMLSGHKDWNKEAAEEVDQALMLAVNTVAFAAPRRASDGFIDMVTYVNGQKTYVGYAPQPFITQATVYDEDPDPDNEKLALAVELYNPNEFGPAAAPQTLYMPQFALSLGVVDPNTTATGWKVLDGTVFQSVPQPPRLLGRGFASVAIHGPGGNTYFDNQGQTQFKGIINDLPITKTTGTSGNNIVAVNLWRRGNAGTWYKVDQFEVDVQFGEQKDTEWYVDAYRDTQTEPYWGLDSQTVPAAARWRMVVAYPPLDTNYKADTGTTAPSTAELGKEGPGIGTRFGPTVPLYLMNATLGVKEIHGAKRPNSFPTVGFLMFVPRFAHVRDMSSGLPTYKPMTEILYESWNGKNSTTSSYDFTANYPPVDFGHMPLFDNQQATKGDSNNPQYFSDNRAGRLPWGQLVYDYFTTLDPAEVDLYRVPGRIDINAAPWYLLAQLPVIGPDAGKGSQNLPLDSSASPAFWDRKSNILVGKEADMTIERFDPAVPTSGTGAERVVNVDKSAATWNRLGAKAAWAMAAYRDRIAYLPTSASAQAYADAYDRNNGNRYRDSNASSGRPGYGQIRRGGNVNSVTNPRKYGFVSLGEVLNVAALDSQVLNFRYAAEQGINYSTHGSDYMRAVSLLALLDTQFLTTRSNTFTVYASVNDRENPQSSVRSQITIDRSNLLPRLVLKNDGTPEMEDTDGNGTLDRPKVIKPSGDPEIIGQREIGYYNTRYDE